MKMTIQGSGVLQDGSRYTRELSITETLEREGMVKEVSAEKIEIEDETCEVAAVRVNGVMLEEVNWRWTRILGNHVPGAADDPFGV